MVKCPELKTGAKESRTGLNELWLEVGMDCDLNCSYCFNSAGGFREEGGTLGLAEYYSLLTQFKEMGGCTVGIPGAGEPLIGRNLETVLRVLDFCGENGLHLVIFTNAHRISDGLIEELNQDHVSLMVKFNSFNPRVQDNLVGVRGYTQRREKVIKKLLGAGFTTDSRLGFVSSIMPVNHEEIPEIFRYCRDNGIIPDFDTLLEQGRGARCGLSGEDVKVKEIFETLQKIDREEYGVNWDISPTYVAGCCDRYQRHMYVTRFGEVSPCIGASLKGVRLGNIREDSLVDLWENPLMKKIRQRDYSGECLSCENYQENKCNSCLGRFADRVDCEAIHTVGCWNKKIWASN